MQDDVKSRKIVNSEPKNGIQSRFEKKSSGLCGKSSPDLNDIEHDFSALKRAIMYSHSATSLDEIIRAYCAT